MKPDPNITSILAKLFSVEHGFKHIVAAGDEILQEKESNHFELCKEVIKHETYQARMLGTYLLGALAAENRSAFNMLKDKVSKDENWRVQEMLAKAFDQYAKTTGFENALPEIKTWLSDNNPDVIRAVIEGLRIWTSRPYFKDSPVIAIHLISQHRAHESDYVRKSVGNALRDIGRKFAELLQTETIQWDLSNPKIAFTYKLIYKNIAEHVSISEADNQKNGEKNNIIHRNEP